MLRIALGSDHGGFSLKNHLVNYLSDQGHQVLDVGTYSAESCDYPDTAVLVAHRVASHRADLGVLVCGSGQGMAMAANRVPGIRAGVVSEPLSAALIVAHNNAQIICLGARLVGTLLAEHCVDAFLAATFEGGRHLGRVQKLHALERDRA